MDDSIWKWFQHFKSNYRGRFMYQTCSVCLLKSCGFNHPKEKNSDIIPSVNRTFQVLAWWHCVSVCWRQKEWKYEVSCNTGLPEPNKTEPGVWGEFLKKQGGNGKGIMHSSLQWKLMDYAFFIRSLFEAVTGDITSGTTSLSHVIPLITSSGL